MFVISFFSAIVRAICFSFATTTKQQQQQHRSIGQLYLMLIDCVATAALHFISCVLDSGQENHQQNLQMARYKCNTMTVRLNYRVFVKKQLSNKCKSFFSQFVCFFFVAPFVCCAFVLRTMAIFSYISMLNAIFFWISIGTNQYPSLCTSYFHNMFLRLFISFGSSLFWHLSLFVFDSFLHQFISCFLSLSSCCSLFTTNG